MYHFMNEHNHQVFRQASLRGTQGDVDLALGNAVHRSLHITLTFVLSIIISNEFLFDYIEPHPLLQKYELSEEEHAQKQCEAQDLYPRTIPNRDDCIRVYDWTVVIDIERLRETRCLFNRTLMDDTMNSV